jgi:hypothetical protein
VGATGFGYFFDRAAQSTTGSAGGSPSPLDRPAVSPQLERAIAPRLTDRPTSPTSQSQQPAGGQTTSTPTVTFFGFGDAQTLAERWNGSSWAVQTTVNRTGAESSFANGASCVSATSCEAVGGYYSLSTYSDRSLAEVWNGTSWTRQPVPAPDGSELISVSCTAANACTAVGDAFFSATIFAMRWNGTSWAEQSIAEPSGSPGAVLEGVSCSSSTRCTAVGYYYSSTLAKQVTLVEVWNGSGWSQAASPNPTGATFDALYRVSCKSATGCEAVGYYDDSSSVERTLAEHWNGTSWTLKTVPAPSGSTSNALNDVSCSATTACTAVGYTSGSGTGSVLAARWNGTAWSLQAVTSFSGWGNGVSCAASTACSAVGYDSAASWNGTTWTNQPLVLGPNGAYPYLYSVSCAAASSCDAVGTGYLAVDVPLAERYS